MGTALWAGTGQWLWAWEQVQAVHFSPPRKTKEVTESFSLPGHWDTPQMSWVTQTHVSE